MFAVIEFNKSGECSLVPLIWLIENDSKCYWPTNCSKLEDLEELVRDITPPKSNWKLYDVKKILCTGDDFEALNKTMEKILEDSSSSDQLNPNVEPLKRKEIQTLITLNDSSTGESDDMNASQRQRLKRKRHDAKKKVSEKTRITKVKKVSDGRKTHDEILEDSSDQLNSNVDPLKSKEIQTLISNHDSSNDENDDMNASQQQLKRKRDDEKKKISEKMRITKVKKVGDGRKTHEEILDDSCSSSDEHNTNVDPLIRNYSSSSESDDMGGSPEQLKRKRHEEKKIFDKTRMTKVTKVIDGRKSHEKPKRIIIEGKTGIDDSEDHLFEKTTGAYEKRISQKNTQQHRTVASININSGYSSDDLNEVYAVQNNTVLSQISKIPRTNPKGLTTPSRISNGNVSAFEKKVLTDLIQIKTTVAQNAICLNDIARFLRVQNDRSIKPVNTPDFPLNSRREFQLFEEFLEQQDNRGYMVNRLAAVGGSSLRNVTMNIMKFIMTNKLAMRYNWSGREKIPFKATNSMEIVNAAVKLSLKGRDPTELNDKLIECGVKDWLKLAKLRYTNEIKKDIIHQ